MRSVSRRSLRASAIRRSVIHRWTLRPVLRRTTVVRCPGVSPTAAAMVGERDRLAVVLLDELEHRREQRLAAEPQVVADVDGDPRGADEQQREVRERGFGGAVARVSEFALDRRDVLGPGGPLVGRYGQALGAAGGPADEREQQRV